MSKRTPLYVYVIIITIILLLLWGQTRDGKLLPEVQEQFSLIIPKTNIAPERNAFISMAGFNVPPTDQMFAEGLKAIEKVIKKTQQTPYEYNMPFILPGNNKITNLYKSPCEAQLNNVECLVEIKMQSAQIKQLLSEQQDYISNYLAIQKHSEFAHILPYNLSSSVPYQYISSVSQLLTAQAILDIQNGQIDKGMRFLINDITFYRHMLSSQQKTLEDTSIFAAALSNHYFVLDRLLHSGTSLKPYIMELEPLLAPLSKQERSLLTPLQNERNYQLIVAASLAHVALYTGDTALGGCYNNSCSFERYFTRLFYKFNDTLNAIFIDWQPTINFAKMDAPLDEAYLAQLKILNAIEVARHTMSTYRLYERYGLFLFKNYAGEKQKNTLYLSQGYSMWFIKMYSLNNDINKLKTSIYNVYPRVLPYKYFDN